MGMPDTTAEVNEIIASIQSRFSDNVVVSKKNPNATATAKDYDRRVYVTCDREAIHDVCQFARDELKFEHCSIVTAVDWVDHLDIVYLLDNYYNGVMMEIVTQVPDADMHIATVSDLWGGANWHERETYELFGIIFDGHKKLERLLTPDTYEFFPFRKSYKLRGQE